MIRLEKREPPSFPGFSENTWLNFMTRDTATGRKLNKKKKRVRLAFLPCRKKTVKTRLTEPRKERIPAGGEGIMSFPHEIIENGLKVIVRRSDLLDIHPALDNPGEKEAKKPIPVVRLDEDGPPVCAEVQFQDATLSQEKARQPPRVGTADRNHMGMGFDQGGDVREIPLAKALALVNEDDGPGEGLDLGQDVARDDHRLSLLPLGSDQADELSP